MASQVSTRGQITIDRAARRALSVRPGMIAVQVVVDDHLQVYFIPARHRRSLFGRLPPRETASTDDWEALEEQAARSIAAEA
jgi:hypothetical protein